MGLNLTRNYSGNFNIQKRQKKSIKFIIIHYTGMKSEQKAIRKLTNQNSKVSTHYFIKNNGNIINMVPDLFEAWHAGKSYWKRFKLLNKNSIGIEINNPGHNNGYRKFSLKQIRSLKKLLKYLIKKYKINLKYILGHSDIAPNRKKDPGEKFPWSELARDNLCHWHRLNQKKIKILRNKKIDNTYINKFFKNLYKIGYHKYKKKYLIKAFQRRFRQGLINGIIDEECFIISKSLIK
tara:strand:- start:128 stop:835 length:708 start_codon:yes stop_codon:yes gene_type:complete